MRWTFLLAFAASSLVSIEARADDIGIDVSVADAKCFVSSGPTGEYPIRFVKSASDRTAVQAKRVRVDNVDTASVTLGSIATKFEVQFDTDSKRDVKVTCEAPSKSPPQPPLGSPRRPSPVLDPWVPPTGVASPPSGPPPWTSPSPPQGPPLGAPPPPWPFPHRGEGGPRADEDDRDGTERSDAALRWLTEEHFRGLRKTPGHFEENGVWILYHLPDGRPAFPLPPHITEHQRVRLRVVVPEGAGVRFSVESCGDVPSFKTEGAFRGARGPRARRAERPEAKFAIVDYTQDLECTKNLAYTVEVRDGGQIASTKTSIAIDSVQRFFVAGGIMFDFAAPQKLSLNDRPAAGGGSEKYIELAHHFAGFRPLITVGVYPCEANPKSWRLCNVFSPIIAIDPTRLDQGAGLGLQVSPVHGLGIAAGADVYLSQKIPDQVKAKPGDTWTVPGDLPVDKRFDAESFGAFLGVTVTLDTITSAFQ